ncbi:PspA/IM30 family protein [Maricaulis sp.]|uniref:PspA/IM30 family protein n=1 Tax=Maricaulis sp. TaxID=1486257 RepID=UPI0026381EEC|nr:PspA/IM30 family protein [Maricaulis sp.]
MFSTLMTIVRGEASRTRDQLENRHAVVILEQKIREAEASHGRAKRALASLILKSRGEERQLQALTSRREDLEDRVEKALKAELDELAREAAHMLARLENEDNARRKARDRTEMSIQRLRHMIDTGQARLIDLKQGLITVKSISAERVSHAEINGNFGGMAAMVEAENVLTRFLDQPDPLDELDIMDELNAELSGEDLLDRLANAGCGSPSKTQAEDVLERIRSDIKQES